MLNVYMLNIGYCRVSEDPDEENNQIKFMNDLVSLDKLYKSRIKNHERIKTIFLTEEKSSTTIRKYLKYFYNLIKENEQNIFIFTINCHGGIVKETDDTIANTSSREQRKPGDLYSQYLLNEHIRFSLFTKNIDDLAKKATVILLFNNCKTIESGPIDYALKESINNNVTLGSAEITEVSAVGNDIVTHFETDNNVNGKLANLLGLKSHINFRENKFPVIKVANLKSNYFVETKLNNQVEGTYGVQIFKQLVENEIFITYSELILTFLNKIKIVQHEPFDSIPYIEIFVNEDITTIASIEEWIRNNSILSNIAFYELTLL